MITRPPQITDDHLRRRAFLYVRQSSEQQLRENVGSQAVQRDQISILEGWGWSRDRIDVVDEDLGTPASEPGLRRGYDRIIEALKAGTHGIVSVTEISRLSRNNLEFVQFALFAQRHNALLAQGMQITDFRDPNSEFIAMTLGANATRENRTRAEHQRRSRRKKAEAGIATTRPPAGYTSRPGGTWAKDSDPRVRDALHLLFDKFFELRSAASLSRFLRRQGIRLPRRSPNGQLHWVDPGPQYVLRLLRNEAYAGSYVFGKTAPDASGVPSSRGYRRRLNTPPTTWTRKEAHHEPYVSLARWIDIQRILTSNRCDLITPVGRGEALVQGLLRCTIHNLPLTTRYPARARQSGRRLASYSCDPRAKRGDDIRCAMIQAHFVDRLIESVLLRTVAPPSIQDIEQAAHNALREHQALVRTRADELRRAEQAAAEAERAYVQIEHDQPYVKRRLAERLEEALRDLETIHLSHRMNPLVPPLSLNQVELAELSRLLCDLPALWRHQNISPERRKTLVRRVVTVIWVTPSPTAWALEIEWTGGAKTNHHLATHHGLQDEVKRAHSEGLAASEVIGRLNEKGIVRRAGNKAGLPYTEPAIRWLIREKGFQQPFNQAAHPYIRMRLGQGATFCAMAAELNSHGIPHYLGRWTSVRIRGVVRLLYQGPIGQVESFPRFPLQERVLALHDGGLVPHQIVSALRKEGALTRKRRPVTLIAIHHILRRHGHRSRAAIDKHRLNELIKELGPGATARAIAQRAGELGLRTRYGNPWPEAEIRRKLSGRVRRAKKQRGEQILLPEPR
jgi:DNA invertase Pin-like site-specific DNA recombinase